MDAFEFSKEAISACAKHSFIREIEIQLLDEPVAKIKAIIDSDTFVSIFYNAETARYSFALIKEDQRVFGIDNVKGWHIHPFESPDSHTESSEISLSGFLDILAAGKDKWQQRD